MTIALSRREFLKVSTALSGGLALEACYEGFQRTAENRLVGLVKYARALA